MARVFRYAVISRVLGVLLLVAAMLKLQGLNADPVGRMGIFAMTEIQVAVIEFELFLAAWLLWGVRPVGAWLLALLAFTTFAVTSAYLGWVGQTSCGCFGRVQASPWAAFLLDIIVVAALLLARPDLTAFKQNWRSVLLGSVKPLAFGDSAAAALTCLLVVVAWLGFGSTAAALAYFRGENLTVSPRMLDLGECTPGETRTSMVEVWNWTDRPVRLVGGTADCSCTVLDDLPVRIPPGESRPITITVRVAAQPGIFNRKAGLLVDNGELTRIDFHMTGRSLVSEEH